SWPYGMRRVAGRPRRPGYASRRWLAPGVSCSCSCSRLPAPSRMETVASVTAPIRARRHESVSGEAAVFLRELVAAATAGARVLDAGCGPGSWPYDLRTDITITGFDIKFPPGPPEPAKNVQVFRGDLARLPLR